MDRTDQSAEASEAQQLEFNRRFDIAYALLALAATLFLSQKTLSEAIAAAKKSMRSYWYWIVGGGGLVGHYVFAPSVSQFSAGIAVVIGTWLYWLVNGFEVARLEREWNRSCEKLREVAASWVGATGHTTFREIEQFVVDGDIFRQHPDFSRWWNIQQDMIWDRVEVHNRSIP